MFFLYRKCSICGVAASMAVVVRQVIIQRAVEYNTSHLSSMIYLV